MGWNFVSKMLILMFLLLTAHMYKHSPASVLKSLNGTEEQKKEQGDSDKPSSIDKKKAKKSKEVLIQSEI